MTPNKNNASSKPSRDVTEGGSRALDQITIGAVRRETRKSLPNNYQICALRNYVDQVGSAAKRAVTHAGGKAEVVC